MATKIALIWVQSLDYLPLSRRGLLRLTVPVARHLAFAFFVFCFTMLLAVGLFSDLMFFGVGALDACSATRSLVLWFSDLTCIGVGASGACPATMSLVRWFSVLTFFGVGASGACSIMFRFGVFMPANKAATASSKYTHGWKISLVSSPWQENGQGCV